MARIDQQERANKRLKNENARLRSQLNRPARSFWHKLGVSVCVVLAIAVLMAGNLLFWAGNTLINTDKYVATVQPLLADKTIQAAIANRLTTQLFTQVDVQASISQALPPKAEFLAPQLTTQLRGTTEKTLQKTLANSKLQALWVSANREAQMQLINVIKESKTTDGVLNLQDVYNRLSQSLQGTKLSFLAGKTLPAKTGLVTVIDAPWLPKARFAVNNIGWLKPASLVLLAVFGALAIWLARNKRRLVIIIGALAALSMIATLIAMQTLQDRIASHAQPPYQAAAGQAVQIILQPLAHQTLAILAFSLLAIVIAWLTGPYRWANCTVSAVRRYLAVPLHELIFRGDNEFTTWVTANRQTLEWVIVALTAFIMLLVQLSAGLVIVYGAMMLTLVLIVEVLAAPHSRPKR